MLLNRFAKRAVIVAARDLVLEAPLLGIRHRHQQRNNPHTINWVSAGQSGLTPSLVEKSGDNTHGQGPPLEVWSSRRRTHPCSADRNCRPSQRHDRMHWWRRVQPPDNINMDGSTYGSSKEFWGPFTVLKMQIDGNLVLYCQSNGNLGSAIWATATDLNNSSLYVLSRQGPAAAAWLSTRTCFKPRRRQLDLHRPGRVLADQAAHAQHERYAGDRSG